MQIEHIIERNLHTFDENCPDIWVFSKIAVYNFSTI